MNFVMFEGIVVFNKHVDLNDHIAFCPIFIFNNVFNGMLGYNLHSSHHDHFYVNSEHSHFGIKDVSHFALLYVYMSF